MDTISYKYSTKKGQFVTLGTYQLLMSSEL